MDVDEGAGASGSAGGAGGGAERKEADPGPAAKRQQRAWAGGLDGVHAVRVKRRRGTAAGTAGRPEPGGAEAAVAAATVDRMLSLCGTRSADIEDLVGVEEAMEIVHRQPTTRLPPVVPCYHPYRRLLEPGKPYRWCACGRSTDRPWCDGSSCREGDPASVLIVVEREVTLSLCGCCMTGSAPICDGSHVHVHKGYEE